MSGLTADQSNTITFLSGVNADGTLATITGWNWNDDTPATYGVEEDNEYEFVGSAQAGAEGCIP